MFQNEKTPSRLCCQANFHEYVIGFLFVCLSVCTLLYRFVQMRQLHLFDPLAEIIQRRTDGIKSRSRFLLIMDHPKLMQRHSIILVQSNGPFCQQANVRNIIPDIPEVSVE